MKNCFISRIVVALCLLGASFFSQAAPDPNFHIYLCFGQSNMEGAASVPDSMKTNVPERFKLLFSANNCSNGRQKGKWYTAIPPLAHCSSGFGPIDYFGRTLVKKLDTKIKVGVVVVAVGGADIKFFESDNAESYVSGEATWFKSLAANYDNNGYKRLVEIAKIAQESGVIKGILVHQGETNNSQTSWPGRLKAVYENLLNDLGLKASEVPLLVGEVRYTGPCSGHNNIIKTVPSVISTAHVISAQGCEASSDQYHFSVNGYKTLGTRYAEKMLELLGDNPVAQVDISTAAIVNKESEPGEVEIMVSKQNNDIKKVEIYADDKLVATDINSFVWKNVAEGTHSIYAVGYDSNNKKYTSAVVSAKIMPEQKPYNGSPAKIPGKIEAEEFDFGGEGNAYHDLDEQNRNEGTLRDESVDMSNTAIGYTQTGEWLEYTVEVEEDGDYIVESRVASGNSTSQFTLYMDNQFIIPGADGTPGGFIDVPNTGDWKTFTTVTTKLNKLTQGTHVLKIEITGDYVDIDYLNFKKVGGSSNGSVTINLTEIKNNDPGEAEVSVSVSGKVIQRVAILLDNEKVGEGTKTTLSNLSEGKHTITAVGYDQDGQEIATDMTSITILAAQKPFNGTPTDLPGKIEAEEFDFGGEGNAYHDNDEENHNGETRNEGVDMSATAVGYIQTGEWIEYTVNVTVSGEYEVEASVASQSTEGSFTLYMDDECIIPNAKSISVPNTESFSTFQTVKSSLNKLSKGVHVLKFEATGNWFDIDYLKFNLLKADESTDLDIVSAQKTIPNGEYQAYDAVGRFIKVVTLKNGRSEELNAGFYILRNELGKTFSILVGR